MSHWNLQQIAQNNPKLAEAMLRDEHLLASFSEDFGKLIHATPKAAYEPQNSAELQALMRYAHEQKLPVTIRGNGLSQSGQSLAALGGLVLSMKQFKQVSAPSKESIWVDANASWADLLKSSLAQNTIPYVIPHNCHLSIGGVLSAGGIGSASFKYGSTIEHVQALEVVKANGEVEMVDAQSPLMQACLGGQGRFAIISKAQIALRPCKPLVRTFFLIYLDKDAWRQDFAICQKHASFIDSFCTSAVQGTKLSEQGRFPFAQWFYALHVSIEYEQHAPEFDDLNLSPWKLLHTQDESMHSYLHRNDARFNAMQITGQWEQAHPWYECFLPGSHWQNIDELFALLPLHYAPLVHVVAVAPPKSRKGFLMIPEGSEPFAIMILNPGLPQVLVPSCLEIIKKLDEVLLPRGGKRYLSGFLGASITEHYWEQHFAERYFDWLQLKEAYDPDQILCSHLYPLRSS